MEGVCFADRLLRALLPLGNGRNGSPLVAFNRPVVLPVAPAAPPTPTPAPFFLAPSDGPSPGKRDAPETRAALALAALLG